MIFLGLAKMTLKFTIVTFSLIGINYFIYTYIDYLEKNNKDEKLKKTLKSINKALNIITPIIAIIGFFMYYKEKKNEYKNKWSFKKFILGVECCKCLGLD